MERSRKLLVAMQGVGLFVVDLGAKGVIAGLSDALVAEVIPGNGDVYLAGTEKGLYKTLDGGRGWQLKGLGEYKIFSLAVHPRDANIIYAGAEPPLLFKSMDGGESWAELAGFGKLPGRHKWKYPPPPHIAHVKSIAIHPEDPEVMYCAIEEGGVVQSVDAGESWKYVSKGEAETFRKVSRATGMDQDCHVVKLSPHNPDIVFVATGDGLYRSDDFGGSWRQVDRANRSGGYFKKYFGPIAIHPRKAEVVYTAASLGSPDVPNNQSSVYRSADGGNSFRDMTKNLFEPVHIVGWNGLVLDPLDPDLLYFGTANGRLYRSADGGESWERLEIDLPEGKIRTLVCVP